MWPIYLRCQISQAYRADFYNTLSALIYKPGSLWPLHDIPCVSCYSHTKIDDPQGSGHWQWCFAVCPAHFRRMLSDIKYLCMYFNVTYHQNSSKNVAVRLRKLYEPLWSVQKFKTTDINVEASPSYICYLGPMGA